MTATLLRVARVSLGRDNRNTNLTEDIDTTQADIEDAFEGDFVARTDYEYSRKKPHENESLGGRRQHSVLSRYV